MNSRLKFQKRFYTPSPPAGETTIAKQKQSGCERRQPGEGSHLRPQEAPVLPGAPTHMATTRRGHGFLQGQTPL